MSKIFEVPLYPYKHCKDQDAKTPARHPVVIVGAGPVGLAMAIDLAQRDIPVVVLDDNDKVSFGSRAICFSKRTLEILDRLGCGEVTTNKGVQWKLGKVYFDERQVFEFNLLPEDGHKRPAFINLQQYYFEQFLVNRVNELVEQGAPIELRGKSRVTSVVEENDEVRLSIETEEGTYSILADWLIAADGASSPIRNMLHLDFIGRVFEDNFLIADIVMDNKNFPVERRFWFDPPFNRNQSALLHKQPDNVWRVDLQLGWNIDKKEETKPENVIRRLKAFLGEETKFELEWVSIYTFQCRRMEKFRHGHILFVGDSAHQVSPFGARGANSGLQDIDNLGWKLQLVINNEAPEELLDSYNDERIYAADENILNSTRATDFITPKSPISRLFRDAVLDLSEHFELTRPMVNSGRLSVPATYDRSSLNTDDLTTLPLRSRPGSVLPDVRLKDGYLLDRLTGNHFTLLVINQKEPQTGKIAGIDVVPLSLSSEDDISGQLQERLLGPSNTAVYLIRPDQHVAARWENYDSEKVESGLKKAIGRI